MKQGTQRRASPHAAPPPRLRLAPARSIVRAARRPSEVAPARPASAILAAAVAVLVFAWCATSLGRFIRWDAIDYGIASGLGLVLTCGYLGVLFTVLAPRLRSRLIERSERRQWPWMLEGMLGHALFGPLLMFAGPLCYASFVLAGGVGLVAYRWLNADR